MASINVWGFDGRQYKINLYQQAQKEVTNSSQLADKAHSLLREVFPFTIILREVPLKGSKTQQRPTMLFADFFIPQRQLIIEVHGEQHYEFNSHFYENKLEFLRAKKRDQDKQKWCELNNIDLVVFNYWESTQEWKGKL